MAIIAPPIGLPNALAIWTSQDLCRPPGGKGFLPGNDAWSRCHHIAKGTGQEIRRDHDGIILGSASQGVQAERIG
jgi:hypothetical protein